MKINITKIYCRYKCTDIRKDIRKDHGGPRKEANSQISIVVVQFSGKNFKRKYTIPNLRIKDDKLYNHLYERNKKNLLKMHYLDIETSG